MQQGQPNIATEFPDSVHEEPDIIPEMVVTADLTDVDMPYNPRELPGMWKIGNILLHPNARHMYDLEGQESHNLKVQKQDHQYHNHPYYPWTSANELWLSNFTFYKAKMLHKVADELLGKLKMDDIPVSSAHQMISTMESATYIHVSTI